MSKHQTAPSLARLLPLVTAAELGPSHRATVKFDQRQSDVLIEHARERAPDTPSKSDRVYRDHLLGIAGEVAVATMVRGKINTEIYPDFHGDDGADVVAPSKWGGGEDRYQVKTTRDVMNPESVVSPEEIDKADYFVLCCSDTPESVVQIVGYIPCYPLKRIGEAWGRDGYLLSGEHLWPVKPKYYSPSEVRHTLYG